MMSLTGFLGTQRTITTQSPPDAVLTLLEQELSTPRIIRFLATNHPHSPPDDLAPQLYARIQSYCYNPVMPVFRCDIVKNPSGGTDIHLQPENLTRFLNLINAAFLIFLVLLFVDGVESVKETLIRLFISIAAANLTIGCALFVYNRYIGKVEQTIQKMVSKLSNA